MAVHASRLPVTSRWVSEATFFYGVDSIDLSTRAYLRGTVTEPEFAAPQPAPKPRLSWGTGQMMKGSQIDFDETARWGAAAGIMYGIGESHPEYKPLADALSRSSSVIATTYKAEGPEFEAQVRKARELCAHF